MCNFSFFFSLLRLSQMRAAALPKILPSRAGTVLSLINSIMLLQRLCMIALRLSSSMFSLILFYRFVQFITARWLKILHLEFRFNYSSNWTMRLLYVLHTSLYACMFWQHYKGPKLRRYGYKSENCGRHTGETHRLNTDDPSADLNMHTGMNACTHTHTHTHQSETQAFSDLL